MLNKIDNTLITDEGGRGDTEFNTLFSYLNPDGQPRMAEVTIKFTPAEFITDDRSVAYYLLQWSEVRTHLETLARAIGSDFVHELRPFFLQVHLNSVPGINQMNRQVRWEWSASFSHINNHSEELPEPIA